MNRSPRVTRSSIPHVHPVSSPMKRQRQHSFMPTLPMHPRPLHLPVQQEQEQDAGASGSDHQYSRDYLMDLLEVSKWQEFMKS